MPANFVGESVQRLETTFDVAAPIELVYRAICDVGEIGYVVAGVKDVQALSQTESQWKVEIRAGIVAQTIKVRGRITEQRPPLHLGFAAEGQNVAVTGAIDLEATAPDLTACRVTVQAEVTGRLAPIVDLVSRTTQKQLIAQTIANFRKKLTGSE